MPCRYLSLPIGSGDKTRTLSVDVCRMNGFGATNHAVKVLKFGETRPVLLPMYSDPRRVAMLVIKVRLRT